MYIGMGQIDTAYFNCGNPYRAEFKIKKIFLSTQLYACMRECDRSFHFFQLCQHQIYVEFSLD